jgi:hypothetical protein
MVYYYYDSEHGISPIFKILSTHELLKHYCTFLIVENPTSVDFPKDLL